jgi:hypothetical protein
MASNGLKQAQVEYEESQKNLRSAQKREERIEHVLDIISAFERNNIRNRLLAIKKLKFYIHEMKIATLDELVEQSGDATCRGYTLQCLNFLEQDEYDRIARDCLNDIVCLSSEAHYEKTLGKLRLYNNKGSRLISEEEIATLGGFIYQLKVRSVKKKLEDMDRRIGGWTSEKLDTIEEVIIFIEDHGIDYADIGETKEEILERSMKIS